MLAMPVDGTKEATPGLFILWESLKKLEEPKFMKPLPGVPISKYAEVLEGDVARERAAADEAAAATAAAADALGR